MVTRKMIFGNLKPPVEEGQNESLCAPLTE